MQKQTITEKANAVSEIRDFLNTNKMVDSEHEFYLSDWFISRFLIARKYHIENTRKMIRGYFDFKKRMEKIKPKHTKFIGKASE